MTTKKFKCVICKNIITNQYGNNPQPIKLKGRCCDGCNIEVISARIKRLI